MAELTLSRRNVPGGPEIEKTYEFDPENGEILKEILALISLKKNGDEKIEKLIAARCAASMEKKSAKSRKWIFSDWLRELRNGFSVLRKRNNHTRQRGERSILNPFPRIA